MEHGGQDKAAGSPDPGRVSVLEQTLWKRLSAVDSLEQLAEPWLSLLGPMVPKALRGMVVVPAGETGRFSQAAVWPAGEDVTPLLSAAVQHAIDERRGAVQGGGASAAAVAYPIVVDEGNFGAVGVELSAAGRADLRQTMRQLQWGVAWLRERVRAEQAREREHVLNRTRVALDLVGTALEQERFVDSCRAVATEIAIQCDCSRVGIGFARRGTTTVSAISHSAQFGKRMNLLRMIATAMDEAIDQRAVILYPAPQEDAVLAVRAHAELAHEHGAGHILTVPFFVNDRHVGAVSFERPAERPFEQDEIDLLECAAAVLGPILEEKRSNDRWIAAKLWTVLGNQLRRLVGPGHFVRKIVTASVLAVAVFFTFATGAYRVTATATIEGSVKRAVVAPYDGFVKEASVRAGDTVSEGSLLASLDNRDFALERLRWVTERQKRRYEYDRAVAQGNRAEIKIVQAQMEQADAQIRLIDEHMARARLTAPFDGLVVAGDLSQSIGAAVSRGDVLFEIAPLDSYRVTLRVDESQVADVVPGKTGQLLVSSLPDQPFPFTIEKVTPVAEPFEGRNTFRVEARLLEQSARFQPGMEGIGKIDIGEERLIWIWTRAMIDWMRLFVWRWLP